MSIIGQLVLADGVDILAIDDLPPETRARVPHDPGDFAISRVRGRESSRVIDARSRELLVEFERPTRIVDAIIRFARRRGDDPTTTLEGAYEMLDNLHRGGVLISPESAARERSHIHLGPGDSLFGWTLCHSVQELEDTQVFFARDAQGRDAAIKVVPGGLARIEREASAMRRVTLRSPEVYGADESEGRGVLVTEWIAGDEATTAAARLRGQRGPRSDARLLALCTDVAQAFADVHGAGLLHGDIHARNILVEATGRARIVDFDLAVELDDRAPHPRGGVAFYVEPELAAAWLRGEQTPSTPAGEQYAIGALLYQLWTGVHAIDFTLERGAMLAQIVDEPPVSFARRQVPAWPDLEDVLRRALAKAAGDRFRSCAELARALHALLPEAQRRDDAAAAQKRSAPRGTTEDPARTFLARCGIGGDALRQGPANTPLASVNYGAAGIAYAFYRLALARDDAHLLAIADVWVEKASVLAGRERAFHEPELDVVERTVGNASLFHSRAGVEAVRALVSLASGDVVGARAGITGFVLAARAPCDFLDLALGKAGLLVGCAELVDAARGAAGCDASAVVACGDELRDEIQTRLAGQSIATSTVVEALGIAHGWAGLLFALLRWSQSRGTPADVHGPMLAELAALREPHGTTLRWPVHNRTAKRPSYMDGWCGGAAGHALLWALAHEQLREPEYAVLAQRAATAAWSAEIAHGTLCCGLAGIGYACAAAHRVTGDAVWLHRARESARLASQDRSRSFFRDSLYKGAIGPMLLGAEIEAACPATPFLERVPSAAG